MSLHAPFLETLGRERIVVVVRARRVHDAPGLVDSCLAAGVRFVEFTLTTLGAKTAIEQAGARGAVIGAGTVLTVHDAREAIAAGAEFLVSPAIDAEVIQYGRERHVPVVAGALTPTEVHHALTLGATAVKVFPAYIGGAPYLRDLVSVYPSVAFIPSGGVTGLTAREFLAAGALAVCAGTSTVDPASVEHGNHEELERQLRDFVEQAGARGMPT